MTKEENKESTCDKLDIVSGFKFGFGFFLANLVGLLIIGLLGWLISFVLKAAGVIF